MGSSADAHLGYGFYVKEDDSELCDTEDWPIATEHLDVTFAGNLYHESYGLVLVKSSQRTAHYGADLIELPDDNHALWDIWLDEFCQEFGVSRDAISQPFGWILAASYG